MGKVRSLIVNQDSIYSLAEEEAVLSSTDYLAVHEVVDHCKQYVAVGVRKGRARTVFWEADYFHPVEEDPPSMVDLVACIDPLRFARQ